MSTTNANQIAATAREALGKLATDDAAGAEAIAMEVAVQVASADLSLAVSVAAIPAKRINQAVLLGNTPAGAIAIYDKAMELAHGDEDDEAILVAYEILTACTA